MTFDLEDSVRGWIRKLKASRSLEAGDLTELEVHLRDEIEDLVRQGKSPEEAFRSAVGSVEGLNLLDSEFGKSRAAAIPMPLKIVRGIVPALAWNYLRVGLRRFGRHKTHAVVNTAGLALGLAAALFIALYVQFELSYDRHYENAERIFRIVGSTYTGTPYLLGDALRERIPDIEYGTAFKRAESSFGSERLTIVADGRPFEEAACFLADASFFSVLPAEFLRGNPDHALSHPRAIVLTRETARLFFGTEDCLGRTLLVNKAVPFQVEAVVEDPPLNSHFRYRVLLPVESGPDVLGHDDRDSWSSWNYFFYFLLKKNASPKDVQDKISLGFPEEYREGRAGQWSDPYAILLQRLTDIHLRSRIRGEIEPNGDVRWIVFFSAVGLLVLGSAVLNYLNLATAQSLKRSREVGMRRILGAGRGQIVRQFLGEALLLAGVASLLGFGLLRLTLPALGRVVGTTLTPSALIGWDTVAILAGLVVAVGFLAGSYPAVFASALDPVRTLKGVRTPGSGRQRVRNGLVLFQFVISLGFGTAALIILSQLHHLRTKDLGIRHEEIVALQIPASLRPKVDVLKRELLIHPGIPAASASNFALENGSYQTFDWEGRREGDDNYVRWFSVDADFVRAFGLKIAEGLDFKPGEESGGEKRYLINRAAAARFGWDRSFGKRLEVEPFGHPGRVAGVVEDFNFRSLHYPIEAVALLLSPPDSIAATRSGRMFRRVPFRSIFLRVSPDDLPATLRFIEDFSKAHLDEGLITWSFLDDGIARLYNKERKIGSFLAVLAAAAAVLAGLGVFGLSSYMVESRLREVSIRRILGAGGGRILSLFSRDFLRLLVWAAVLSFPVVFWRVSGWLDTFAFRIRLGPWFFVGGLVLMALLLVCAVGWPILRTARTDPAYHLRSE